MSRRLLMLGVGAAALLLVAWFLFLWSPQSSELKDAKKRTSTAESQNSELELRLSRLQAAQKDAPELMATGEKLRRAVPATPDLAQFILDANDAATAAGVDFLSISPAPPTASATGGPSEVHLQLAVTGTYPEVVDYLDRLDDLPRLVVVDSLGLTPGGGRDSASADLLSVNVTARMFTTAVPATATTGPTGSAPSGSTTSTTAGGSTTTTTTTAASRG